MSPTPSNPTIYFAYGSNLWLTQMSHRCPTAAYIGIARLPGHKWLINTRGYANVVKVSDDDDDTSKSTSSPEKGKENDNGEDYATSVYGLVYTISSPAEEADLDKNEGVPVAYTKCYETCDFWSSASDSDSNSSKKDIDVSLPPTRRQKMLVYIDKKRVESGVPRREYVYRMNRGLEDAVRLGVPRGYVDGVVRRYIPEDGGQGEGDEEVKGFAREQAKGFRDESGVFPVGT